MEFESLELTYFMTHLIEMQRKRKCYCLESWQLPMLGTIMEKSGNAIENNRHLRVEIFLLNFIREPFRISGEETRAVLSGPKFGPTGQGCLVGLDLGGLGWRY